MFAPHFFHRRDIFTGLIQIERSLSVENEQALGFQFHISKIINRSLIYCMKNLFFFLSLIAVRAFAWNKDETAYPLINATLIKSLLAKAQWR
jgi:hypothetical protein